MSKLASFVISVRLLPCLRMLAVMLAMLGLSSTVLAGEGEYLGLFWGKNQSEAATNALAATSAW